MGEGKVWFEAIKSAFTDKSKRMVGLEHIIKNLETVLGDIQAVKENIGTNDFLAGDKLGDVVGIYVFGPKPD